MKDFDVIIVGKTIVGLALACGLSDTFKVAIVDDRKFHITNSNILSKSINVSMISFAVSRLLQYLKVWDSHLVNYVNPYHAIRILEKDSLNSFTLNHSYLGYPYLGYIIDNSVLYAKLLYRAYEFKNICFIDNVYLCRLMSKQNMTCFIINKKKILSAGLAVITSGYQNSLLYQNLDVSLIFQSYPYLTLVGSIFSKYLSSNVVYYCFCKQYILILLPLTKSHYFFVFWLLYSECFHYSLGNFYSEDWNELFVRSFNKLGNIIFQDDIHLIPCVSRYIKNFSIHHRLLLLGDASYDVSPFKYQNINRDLMDVIMLLDKIKKCKNFFYENDINHSFYLRDYEQNRRCAAIKTFIKTQCLSSCFMGTNIITRYIRAAIFQIMNNSSLSIMISLDIMRDLIGFYNIPNWLLREYYD